MIEIWKEHPILGIMVSNLGRVETERKGKHFGHNTVKVYKQVGWNHKQYSIHRLVYETFIGEIPNGYDINHIDENKTNNRVDNLNLMTHKENCNWGTRNERVSKKLTNREDQSKPVNQYTKDGRLVKTWLSTREAGRCGYNIGGICLCCTGKRKTHKGYIWKYK